VGERLFKDAIVNWSSASDFFAMGGYGLYVWGSYGVTIALVVMELVSLVLRRRALQNKS
jgi:heme exporter protein D